MKWRFRVGQRRILVVSFCRLGMGGAASEQACSLQLSQAIAGCLSVVPSPSWVPQTPKRPVPKSPMLPPSAPLRKADFAERTRPAATLFRPITAAAEGI